MKARSVTFEGEIVGHAYAVAIVAIVQHMATLSRKDQLAAITDRDDTSELNQIAAAAIARYFKGCRVSFLDGKTPHTDVELRRGLMATLKNDGAVTLALEVWMRGNEAAQQLKLAEISYQERCPRRAAVSFPDSLANGVASVDRRLSEARQSDGEFGLRLLIARAARAVWALKSVYSKRHYFPKQAGTVRPGEIKTEIEAAIRVGWSERKIALAFGISHSSVNRIGKAMKHRKPAS